jgi:predicted GNAT superfamily acetyltransferase
MIEYREVHDPDELKQIVTLQMIVWAMSSEADAVPHNMLHAVIHSGGMVIRADMDGELVGFALALPARRNNRWALWSHMAGVIPAHQGKGIGFGVKQAQRRWALEHDYPVMAWTFDPLQRGNANFNLRLLRTTSSTYHVNFYGVMTDGINAGMPSDRLEVEWNLNDGPVAAAALGTPPPAPTDVFPQEDFLLYTDEQGRPHLRSPLSLSSRWHFVEIPYDLAALKRDNIGLAIEWQLGLRQAMQTAFAAGYRAVDFAGDSTRCWYVLERR